jgi:GNAT superfamily N-acetyltransferase
VTSSEAIRVARPDDYPALRAIEYESEELFLEIGIGPFTPDAGDHLEGSAVVLVAGDPAVGFASVGMVDGVPHLWQLSVLPAHGRRGVGTSLVRAVCEWAASAGHRAVTLTTFRDVAWNAPFYARLGFVVTEALPPGLAAIRDQERVLGDDDFGPRVAMRKTPLTPASGDHA